MRLSLRLVAPTALLAMASAAVPALGSAPSLRIDFRGDSVVRGDLGRASGPARAWALEALRAHAARLGVDAAAFRLEQVRTSLTGTHVRGRQQVGGVPVKGSSVLVSAVGGRVVQVDAIQLRLPGAPVAQPVGEVVARAAALDALRVTSLLVPTAVERALVARDGRLVDVYRVSVVSQVPARAATVEVAAATGRVLAVLDESDKVDGTATVFDPNPVVTARSSALRQPAETGLPADADLDSPELTAQLRRLPLRSLDPTALASGRLSGPYVNVLAEGYAGKDVAVTRADPRFEGAMAYAHLDRFQRYLQSLGFRGRAAVNAEPQEVAAVPVYGFDNSFYQPGNDLMLLGNGGVDDGEDADVIVHEYGHALQDAQVPGYGETADGGAMGEGFGDFAAAAYFARSGRGFHDVCIADWDATSYDDAAMPCLRRVDSTKRYPRDLDRDREVHADGELWSAFLWRLRASLGRTDAQRSDNSLRLVVAMHEFLTPQATFGDAVAGLRTAARALGRPEWAPLVDRAARR
ncbi:MAG: putative neutral metalloprotease, partial [Frankiales bacterium]|nr:putative neutral metalloprotease [Frankiales bacterium]